MTEAATASAPGTEGARDGERFVNAESPRVIGPGDCLGRYVVRTLIGAGGMGRVFAATDSELGRSVALKVIRPDRSASSHARARLLREAQALAQVRHRNVVTIHDVGAEDGHVFLAMELVEGVTLADWLAGKRSWRAVRETLLAAGRGLAAAHAVGIVHRDFKPQNVIIGDDRVVVVDFGLARADGEAPEEAGDEPTADGLHLALTLTGERVGTPSYMAPEQHAGAPTTAATDQYAFCIVVHEALYGKRPAEGVTVDTRGVPRYVAAAIARGLAPRPEDRWPSMDALLAVLGRRFWTRRRTRIALAAGAALIAAIAIVGFGAGRRAAAVAACSNGDALIAPIWTDATRAEVRDAFRQAAGSDAKFADVDTAMRDRMAEWSHTYRDNCEATRVRHEQSDALFDLRAECLGRVRTKLTTLIELLRKADAGIVPRAARATSEVASFADCADRAALGASIALPPPEQAAAVAVLRNDLARVDPLFWLGKWQESSVAAQDVVTRARRLGYRPLLARALAVWANIEANTGHADDAIRDFYEVAELGGAVGDDDVLARALPQLSVALADGKNQFEAADLAHHWAAAAVERAGRTPTRVLTLYGNRAISLNKRGDHAGALVLYRELLATEAVRNGETINVAWANRSIGEELAALGRPREATAYYARGVEIGEHVMQGDHPLLAMLLTVYGQNLVETFQNDAALRVLERARTMYQRTLGAGDLREATALYFLGIARMARRELPEARTLIEQAIAIQRDKPGAQTRNLASDLDTLADIAVKQGKLAEAEALSAEAMTIRTAELPATHEEVGLSYRSKAGHLLARGRVAEARAAIDQALAIHRKANGERHPYFADALLVDGDVRRAEHRDADAVTAYARALAICEAAYGDGSVGLLPALARLSAALIDTGDLPRADTVTQRERAIAAHGTPGERAAAELRIAEVQWARGEDRPAALARAKQAREALAALPFPAAELPRADRWLATR